MPARKPYKVDIDVIPYLSIMAIVLKLICLILIVTVMRIALNPNRVNVIKYEELVNLATENGHHHLRVATYLDCHRDRIEVRPDGPTIEVANARNFKGELSKDLSSVIHDLEVNTTNNYAILIIRNQAYPVYFFVKNELKKRHLEFGYDVLEESTVIDWGKAKSALSVKLDSNKTQKVEAANPGQPVTSPAPPNK